MFTERQSLVVWLHSLKNSKQLRKFGNIHFVSKRLKYVIVYCNKDEIEGLQKKLTSLPYVKQVDVSYRPFIKDEFETKMDKAKEYDYKTEEGLRK